MCHGKTVIQYHERSGSIPGPPEHLTQLGSFLLEDGAEGHGTASPESPGVFVARYSRERRQTASNPGKGKTSSGARGHGSRLHSAEIVYSFVGGDRCEGSANGGRSGAHVFAVLGLNDVLSSTRAMLVAPLDRCLVFNSL